MAILLYHRNLSLTSGTGQLVRMQAHGLREAGERVALACQRRALNFFLKTGLAVRRMQTARVGAIAAAGDRLVVDHGLQIPQAQVVFVHNVVAEANRHLRRADLITDVQHEHAFFAALAAESHLIANSDLTRNALIRHFGLPAARIDVQYPGYRSDRFRRHERPRRRRQARRRLRLDEHTPVVGFVTSGDFHKRGLDLFLLAAEQIAARRPDVRYLIVGSRRLPDYAAAHPLRRSGRLQYRPKSGRPDLWMAALDIFLYPARFEEFGMVVAEAVACGIPVVTSRRVGASECLPPDYDPWLADAPVPGELADKALMLLDDRQIALALADSGSAHIGRLHQDDYIRRTVAVLKAQKRQLR